MASAKARIQRAPNNTFWLSFQNPDDENAPTNAVSYANANLAIDALKTQIGAMAGSFFRADIELTSK